VIRAVTFDFWQTLLADTPENLVRATALRLDGVKAALERNGHPVARETLEAAYEASGRRLAAVWREHRDLPCRDQVAVFLAAAAPGLRDRLAPEAFDEVVRAYTSPALSYPPVPSPGAVESVNALASRGVVLAVVSNTGRTPGMILRQVLARFGLLERFRILSFSDEIGVRKPDPEIFRVTLAQTGVEPRHAVHVGDTPGEDIAGARAAGMRAVHYAADGRPPSDAADLVVHDLAALPAALATLA